LYYFRKAAEPGKQVEIRLLVAAERLQTVMPLIIGCLRGVITLRR